VALSAFRRPWQSWAGLDRRVWQIALARAINTMGLSLVMSFLGIYIVDTRGYPAWLYGVIALVANLCQSLSSAWAGNSRTGSAAARSSRARCSCAAR
jgi:hypothetical protein